MSRITTCSTPAPVAVILLLALNAVPSFAGDAKAAPDIGVDRTELSSTVNHPYVALSGLKRAVFLGKERDPDTGKSFKVRIEVTVRDAAQSVAGVNATVVDVAEYADDEVVEKARDFYAQHASGVVHYLGEEVDSYDGDKIVGHDGAWLAGEKGCQTGIFMPATPKVGDVFPQERAPGSAGNRTKVLSTTRVVKVPAGTFKDCVEVDEYDAVEKSSTKKWFCPGVGLVKEASVERTIELAERVAR